ncbi:MAG: AAA family ATPase [Candidatus Thiodiazotropha sp.]
MLQLRALHIENFGPFKGQQTIDFPSDDGVVIVYGENMRGKTSLLNAIRFAFFGKVIGRGSKSTALHDVGNWEQRAIGKYGFKVELEFISDGCQYKLTRVCTPRVSEPVSDADYTVEHYLARDGDVLGPDQAAAELTQILPEQVSRFFLFDGELLQEYEDLLSSESDMGRRIKESIERILGVPILTSARATTMRLMERSEKQEATAAQRDQKTQEYGNQLSDIHEQRDALKEDEKKLQHDLEELREQKATLEEALKRKERYATLMGRRDSLQQQVDTLTERHKTKQAELETEMSTAWCAILTDKMRNTAIDIGKRRQKLETAVMRWNALQEIKTTSTGTCPTCLREITPEVRDEIEKSLSLEQSDAFESKKQELADVNRRLDALQTFINAGNPDTLKVRWETSEEIAVDIASKKDEISELKRQLETVDEATLRKDKSDFEKTVKEIDVTERALNKCQEDLAANKVNADNLKKRLDKLAGTNLQKERERLNLYTKIYELLDDSVAEYREQLRRHVEADATRHFKALTTEPEYAELSINDNYGLTILHEDGKKIPVRSAGAEHVVALSLVGALQNNAPLQGPIIIDSPFGRLDTGHTTNIVRALPDMAGQVMLLVYEDELPAGLARNELKGKLKAEWSLERRSARHTELTRRRD